MAKFGWLFFFILLAATIVENGANETPNFEGGEKQAEDQKTDTLKPPPTQAAEESCGDSSSRPCDTVQDKTKQQAELFEGEKAKQQDAAPDTTAEPPAQQQQPNGNIPVQEQAKQPPAQEKLPQEQPVASSQQQKERQPQQQQQQQQTQTGQAPSEKEKPVVGTIPDQSTKRQHHEEKEMPKVEDEKIAKKKTHALHPPPQAKEDSILENYDLLETDDDETETSEFIEIMNDDHDDMPEEHTRDIESVVDETLKNSGLDLPIDGALNVNIINVYVATDANGKPIKQPEVVPDSGKQQQPEGSEAKPPDSTKPTGEPVPIEKVEKVAPEASLPSGEQEELVVHRDKIPSFDDWKQKMLAEQAEQEKSKQLEAAVNTVTNGGSQKGKSSKRMTNFAAMTCGAKVLSTNPEARNTGSVLTENRDQYMIQPCKAKKWFVVELCEPVQVRSLEIANLELFSSQPESFVVHISDRHPTKEWKALGTFHAREERTIQSFSVGDVEMFAKFVKIEMLSHYGKEHYCPLTIIRVFGTTVDEDYEDTDQTEEQPVDEEDVLSDAALQKGGRGDSGNLFDSAKDTVMSIVKNVLNAPETEGKEAVEQLDQMASNNATLNSTLNATAVNASSQTGDNKSCTEDSDSPATKGPASSQQLSTDGQTSDKDASGKPVVTKLETTTEPESQGSATEGLVTLIERPQVSLQSILQRCGYCQQAVQDRCYFGQSTSCGYQKVMHFIYPTSCVQSRKQKQTVSDSRQKGSEEVSKGAEVFEQIPLASAVETDSSVKDSSTKIELGNIAPTPVIPASDVVDSKHLTGSPPVEASFSSVPPGTVEQTVDKSASESEGKDVEAKTYDTPLKLDDCVAKGGTVIAGPPGVGSSCTVNVKAPKELHPSATISQVVEETETVAPNSESPSSVIETLPERTDKPKETVKEGATSEEPAQEKPVEAKEPEKVEKVNENGMKNIYAEEPSTEPSELDLEMTAETADNLEEPIQKLSSKNKETAFMRLKNRIKELELNLNLSSTYLEELSKNYKRQMEDMYTSLNRTIAKLSNTSKWAESRDLKQQEYIKRLENHVNNLTTELKQISSSISDIHKQVIERHLFLMFVEAVVFLALFSLCVGWRRQSHSTQPVSIAPVLSDQQTTKTQTPHSNGVQPLKVKKSQQKCKRRNSIDFTPPRPKISETITVRSVDDMSIRTSVSEDSVTIIEPNIPIFLNPTPEKESWDIVKQKKRKKKHQKKLSWGNEITSSFNKESSVCEDRRNLQTLKALTMESASNSNSAHDGTAGRDRAVAAARAKAALLNGTRRSLDSAPTTGKQPQNRRFSDQMKSLNDKGPQMSNGTLSEAHDKAMKLDRGLTKSFTEDSARTQSQSLGTYMKPSSMDSSKNRGMKHWFPGIKNVVTN